MQKSDMDRYGLIESPGEREIVVPVHEILFVFFRMSYHKDWPNFDRRPNLFFYLSELTRIRNCV
jgi:hypothetical protein